MEQLIHEDAPKYDLRHKSILVATPTLTFITGVLAYIDGYRYDIISSVMESESKTAAVVFLGATVLVVALYWVLLPKRFSIFDDRIEIKFGIRCLNIDLDKIEEVRPARGRMSSAGFGCVTSTRDTVEISMKSGINLRISPTNMALFLENLNKTLNPRLSDPGLGKLLLNEGIISEEQMNTALDYQAEIGGKMGALLVKLGFVQPKAMMDTLSKILLVQEADLSKKKIDWDTLKKIDRSLLERHLVVPVEGEKGKVTLVMADPTDMEIIKEIEFVTELPSVEEIATTTDIIQILKQLPHPPAAPFEEASPSEDTSGSVAVAEPHRPEKDWKDANTANIVRALTKALIESGVVTEEKLNEKLESGETESS